MAGQSASNKGCSCKEKEYVRRDGMRFLRTQAGLVFYPEYNPNNRKHSCPDCAVCAFCADARCSACLGQGGE
ncbi:hypothetical protein [Desulfatibacillum aliphaticivorans]|uniref:hypothetical protein n=1 Tax=Desulfatibacillum aliphaticivorans TaxID=218208 RepID=UPI000406C562|nr:hypothetical protein [Desulfatibacillum aliphaticivorans]